MSSFESQPTSQQVGLFEEATRLLSLNNPIDATLTGFGSQLHIAPDFAIPGGILIMRKDNQEEEWFGRNRSPAQLTNSLIPMVYVKYSRNDLETL